MLSTRQQNRLLIVLATVITILLFSAGSSVKQPESPTQTHSEYKDPQARQNGEADETFRQWLTKDAASFFTAVLAFLTTILAGVSIFQIIYLRRADETSTKTAEAAINAVAAANRSAKAAEEASYTDRAWILFEGFTSGFAENAEIDRVHYDKGYVISLNFTNAGRTPAIKVAVNRDFQIIDQDEVVPVFPELLYTDSKSVVGQGKDASANYIFVNFDEVQMAIRHEKRLIIHLCVNYYDIFQDIRRNTLYTAEFVFTGKRTTNGMTSDAIHLNPMGNQNGCT